MIVEKGAKVIQWIVFTINGGAKKKINVSLTPYIKIHSKWIIDLNIKHNTSKSQECRKKSSWFKVRQRVLRYKNKSTIHKRKKLTN